MRVYRASEIRKRIVHDEVGRAIQMLVLKKPGQEELQAYGFQPNGVRGELKWALDPIPGQDSVELRVKNPAEPDPRKWNVLAFQEPESCQSPPVAIQLRPIAFTSSRYIRYVTVFME